MVVARDRVCVRCGGDRYLGAHHVIPRAAGGLDHPANLVTVCAACHGGLTRAEEQRERSRS